MRGKLTLNLEDLSVDSFDTTGPHKAKGTVFGEQCTCYTQCTCPGCPTCDATCEASCANTCAYTCDDASCAGTCETCDYFQCRTANCTEYEMTCNGNGTCGVYPCRRYVGVN
jgi:hypothetical protein